MNEEQLLQWLDMLASWAKSDEVATPPRDLYGAMAAELAALRKERQWWRNPELLR